MPASYGQLDDAEGVASLFAVERQAMLRMATLMVGSVEVAEEVVQDAFVVVGRRWSSLDRPGAYLRTTVVNGCAQVLRRRDAERWALAARVPGEEVELPSRLVELRDALDRLSERISLSSCCAISSISPITRSPRCSACGHRRASRG